MVFGMPPDAQTPCWMIWVFRPPSQTLSVPLTKWLESVQWWAINMTVNHQKKKTGAAFPARKIKFAKTTKVINHLGVVCVFFLFSESTCWPQRYPQVSQKYHQPNPTLVAAVALHSKTQPTWFHQPLASLKVHRYHKHHPYSIDGAQISWRPPKDMGIFFIFFFGGGGYSFFSNDLSGIKGDDRSGMDLSMVVSFFLTKDAYGSNSSKYLP